MVFFHMPIIIFLPHPKKWLLLFGTKTGQQSAPVYSDRQTEPENRLESRSGNRREAGRRKQAGKQAGEQVGKQVGKQVGELTGRTGRTGNGAGIHTGSGIHKII